MLEFHLWTAQESISGSVVPLAMFCELFLVLLDSKGSPPTHIHVSFGNLNSGWPDSHTGSPMTSNQSGSTTRSETTVYRASNKHASIRQISSPPCSPWICLPCAGWLQASIRLSSFHLNWLRCSLGEFACTASCVTLGQTSGLCTDEGNILQFGLFMNLTAKNNRIFHSRANCFALKDYGFQTKFPLAGAPSRGQSAWDHFHIRLFLQLLCSRELKL